MMLYNWRVSKALDSYMLLQEQASAMVEIPMDGDINALQLMEVCVGIGGISAGLKHLGYVPMVGMDVNPYMCDTLRANGHPHVLQGDLLCPDDRRRLHQVPKVFRGTLAAGFPCQPLSTQGDQKGEADPRALPFVGVLQVLWEQQHGSMILECVPNALTAPWVQSQLQRLAWSMGMHYEQRVLMLDRCWPCRRARWWLYMVPQKYQLHTMMDLPLDKEFQRLEQLFPRWTTWSPLEMDELFVPVNDLAKFSDERYGNDIRRLQQNGPCPCILHSYSFGLTACPCGCRHFPFSEIRLRQAGLRGFFVVDEATGRNRYLHVKEAALLCTLDPLMNFGASSKDGLCLIGQIAAPIQALWVGTYLLESLGLFAFPRETILQTYKWHLLRRATYAWPTPGTDQFRLYDAHEQNWVTVVVDTPSTLSSILLAEHRLQHEAMILKIQDPWEVLPPTAFASPSSSTGPLSLLRKAKRQRIERAHEQIVHQVPVWSNDDLQLHHITLPSGSFVFELFAAIDCLVQVDSILDVNQIEWRADDRLWKPVVIASYASRCTPRVTAQGPTTTGGLSDVGLDGAACRVMACSGQPRVFWVPAATSTSLLHQTRWQNSDGHPYLGALHGSVFTAIAMEDHWLLVELKVKGTKLHVSSWTGMDINDDSLLCTMIGRICHSLALQGYVLHRHFWITEQLPHTCGAVVILHLGCRLKLWTLRFHPTEEDMYIYIRHQFPDPGTYTAKGKTSLSNPEQDVVWQLRDMLKAKGVDDSRSIGCNRQNRPAQNSRGSSSQTALDRAEEFGQCSQSQLHVDQTG